MGEKKDIAFTRWLCRTPQPVRLRCIREDAEPSVVEISGSGRKRWSEAEESVLAERAERVQALDKEDRILRTYSMPPEVADKNALDKAPSGSAADYKGQAAVVRAIAETHNEAFERGAQAASQSSDALIALVETLVVNLNAAIVNNHNMAVALGNVLTGKDVDEGATSQSSQAMERLIVALGARYLSGGAQAAQPPQPNGAKKP